MPKECHPYTNMPKFKATTTTTKPKMQSCPRLLEKESQIPWVLPVITTVTIYSCLLETTLSSSSEDLEFKINKAGNQGCRPFAEMLSSIPKAPRPVLTSNYINRGWCHLSVILVLQRQRQADPKFKAALCYIACLRPFLALWSSLSKWGSFK